MDWQGQQVNQADALVKPMATMDRKNTHNESQQENLTLFRSIIREEINGAVDKLQPQLIANFFKELFKDKNLPCAPEVEIAHRVGSVTNQSNDCENANISFQISYFKNSEEGRSAESWRIEGEDLPGPDGGDGQRKSHIP